MTNGTFEMLTINIANMENNSLKSGNWIAFAIIPIIFSIGIVSALPVTEAAETLRGIDLSERDFSCRAGQTLVFHYNRNNYICTATETAHRWVELGMAEIVTVSEDEPEQKMRAPVQPPTPFGVPITDEMMEEFTIDPEKIVYENNNFSLVQVADYIYSFGDGVYFSMIMVTDEGILVADPNNQNHSENLIQAIRTISDQPITYLVYSHSHWDHSSGGQVFKDSDGTTILSHVDARDWLLEHPNPNVAIPDEVWEGNLHEIVLGGKTLQLHHFGPSHGEGMTVFHFPEDKIIFIVDIVTPKRIGFTILPDFFPKEWERTLTEVEVLDFDIAMFAHDRAYGPASEVTEIREYVQDLRAETNRMIQDGVNPFMIPSTIELPKYQDWAMYDEWLGLNAWRVMLEILMGW